VSKYTKFVMSVFFTLIINTNYAIPSPTIMRSPSWIARKLSEKENAADLVVRAQRGETGQLAARLYDALQSPSFTPQRRTEILSSIFGETHSNSFNPKTKREEKALKSILTTKLQYEKTKFLKSLTEPMTREEQKATWSKLLTLVPEIYLSIIVAELSNDFEDDDAPWSSASSQSIPSSSTISSPSPIFNLQERPYEFRSINSTDKVPPI